MIKRTFILTFSILTLLTFLRCDKDTDSIQISQLKKSWTSSYEENTIESVNIYRPSDHMDFPPSRFRQVFNFKENNICEYRVLAPNDAHYMAIGTWKYYENGNIVNVLNVDSEILYEFEILKLTEDILVLD